MDEQQVTLNEKQQEAVNLVADGKNVFITGPAGVGKSLVIQKIEEWAGENGKRVSVTAMTGVAAANVGGSTLHSWASIGLGKHEPRKHAFYVKKSKPTLDRYSHTDILIIDEVSMADYEYISTLNSVVKIVRNKIHKAFGGIQLVLCGDFFQLGPVQKNKDKTTFLFQDPVWNDLVDDTVHLTQVYRQTQSDFINTLHRLRVGDVDDSIVNMLRATKDHKLANDKGIRPTILFCRNCDVDAINRKNLDDLKGESVKFINSDYFEDGESRKLFENSFTLPTTMELKVGAQVMLLVNKDVLGGLVNGSRGVVTEIYNHGHEEHPSGGVRVLFANGRDEVIKEVKQVFRYDCDNMDAPERAYRIQVPLKLAYALTIHKSQGMSIDYLEIDMTGCFAHGQAYVALSRATSFDTLRVTNFNKKCIITSEVVKNFYRNIDRVPLSKRKVEGPLERMFGEKKIKSE